MLLIVSNILFASQPTCAKNPLAAQTLDVLIDSAHQYTYPEIEQAEFKPTDGAFSYGYSAAAIWVKATLSIPNECPEDQAWFLRLAIPYHDRVDIYTPQIDGAVRHWLVGDKVPVSAELGRQRLPLIPLDIHAGETQTVYLRFESQNALNISMDIISQSAWQLSEQRILVVSAFVGALIVLALSFALIHIVIFKVWGFSYYLVFVSIIFFLMMFIYGWDNLLWSHQSGDAITTFTHPLGLIALLLLSNWMLNLYQHFPRLFIFQFIVGVMALAWAIWAIYQQQYRLSLPISQVYALFILVSLVLQSAWLAKKHAMARLFLIGFSFLFVALVLRVAVVRGWIELNFWTENSMSLALVAQMVLFLMAMVLHYYRERETRLRLQVMADEAQHEISKRRIFMNLLSHELLTPLAVLDAGTRNLQEDFESAEPYTKQQLVKQRQVIKKMRRILDACLSTEHYKQRPHSGQIDFSRWYQQLQIEWADLEGNERIQWPSVERLPRCTIQGDGQALVLALTLIMQNALKYSPASCRLNINIQNNHVRLCVEDQGPGFADNVNPPKPFQRGHNVPQTSGLGLGLTLAHEIIQLYQGQLNIASDQHGSQVCLQLPCVGSD